MDPFLSIGLGLITMKPEASKYPSQTVLISIYGCNKYQLGDKMRNCMHIPDEYLPALTKYRMVHVTGKHFSSILVDGTIHFPLKTDTTRYAVIYHNCTPFAAKRAVEVRLSFRMAAEEFHLEPIVLVEVVDSREMV